MELYVKMTDEEYESYKKFLTKRDDFVDKSNLTIGSALYILGFHFVNTIYEDEITGKSQALYENENEDLHIMLIKDAYKK